MKLMKDLVEDYGNGLCSGIYTTIDTQFRPTVGRNYGWGPGRHVVEELLTLVSTPAGELFQEIERTVWQELGEI